jgi:hypothetical protein
MSGAADIRAGGAYIEMWGDDKRLKDKLKSSKADAKKWASDITSLGIGFTALGSAIVAPLAMASKSFADQGSLLDDISQRTGIGIEALGGLKYAAELTGTGIDDLTTGFKKMAVTVDAAETGQETAIETLKRLGLAVSDVKGKKPEELFAIFADRIAGVHDPIQRSALAMDIFGKSGGNLIPMLALGAAGLSQLHKEAESLGLIMSEEDAKAAAEFGDSLDRTWAACRGFAITIGGALAPALKAGVELFVAISKPVREWISQNKELVTGLALAGVVILGAGLALTALGISITFIGTAIAGLTALAGVVAAVALSPATWIVAVVAAVVGIIGYVTGAFAGLQKLFGTITAGVTSTVQGVANAIRAGKVDVAWKIVLAALQIAWLQTTTYCQDKWQQFSQWFGKSMGSAVQQFGDIVGGIVETFGDVVKALSKGDIQTAWAIICAALGIAWISTVNELKDTWREFSLYLGDALTSPLKAITSELAAFAKELKAATGVDIGIKKIASIDKGLSSNTSGSRKEADKARKKDQAELRQVRQVYNTLTGTPTTVAEAQKGFQALLDSVKPPDAVKSLHDVPDLADVTKNKNKDHLKDDIVGAVSSRGAASIAGNSTNRIAKASEETAKNTKKIAEKGPLEFGT